ncbi:hypothetical protein SAMN05660662_3517 [Blastococcus aurantiacus]|uniref:Uncharacterized protein n=1 Tax=Blastococcus aurantiacus TaxID=1550231 RepID=A0A1G7P857_9ACTN|nr:hypothetical protein [Blastococcus aurantiacus]SDF82475.1 hypothetical protein SAMN05660662_3517 [Blastococcus aurantiacus]
MTDGTRAPTREIGDDATAKVAERARHNLRVVALGLSSLSVGFVLLRFDPARWSAEGWTTAAAFAALLGAIVWLAFGTAAGRRRERSRLIAEYAVVHHVDPGPGRRAPADRQAQQMAREWTWLLLLPLFLAPQLALASWERLATAVPGAVLVSIGCVVLLADKLRLTRAARRWLADPPGPPRD